MIRLIGQEALNVTPSDTNYITDINGNRAIGTLYVGTTGDLVVLPWLHADTNTTTTGVAGGAVVYKNVPVGFFPIAVKKVFSTGTTASNLVVQTN